MIVPVILSGGSGTRLWPLSRKHYPKQLLPLVNETTMLQDTVNRVAGFDEVSEAVVICNEEYRFMVAEQMRESDISNARIILEPVGRNTAPAIALAAHCMLRKEEDPVLLVLPADHVIENIEAFHEAVIEGEKQARDGKLVTFGVVPNTPETGFGYIRAKPGSEGKARAIERFVEKPDAATAQSYFDEGGYYWNSGMFMFTASRYLEALKASSEEMFNACDAAIRDAEIDLDFVRIDREDFEACPSNSIDYAVMEKSDNGVVIPVDIGWSDVGSWAALHQIGVIDENGNRFIGDVRSATSTNTYVRTDKRLVVTLGVNNLIVVDTQDAVLVADRDHVQDIKQIVEQLTSEGRDEVELHKRVFRPWGNYEGIDEGTHYQVKRIVVNPGCSLSLQMHHHRAEHWIVVSGTAQVTRGEEKFILSENQSTYIPLGETHRLENIGKIPLHLIEVQTGSYLGEDDIIRFDDVYGRHE